MAQLLTFRLTRTDGTQSWGFRLQGGKDFGTPLLIQKVNGGSLAERAGLRVGDALIRVNNVEVGEQRHKDAQDVIIRAGNAFDVTVQRGGVVTWKPSVSPVGSIPSPNSHISVSPVPVTKTSLAATYKPGSRPPHGFNSASKPFSPLLNGGAGHEAENGAVKAIVNKQYNSPVGIYSDESIAETLSAQAEVLAGGVLGVNFKKNEKNYNSEGSEVFKMLREAESETKWPEPADEPRSEAHEAPVPGLRSVSAPRPKSPSADSALAPGKNICADCERLIVGVFVRIKGKNLHVECFKCATCGTSLKNVGYYSINEKLYCDIHAKMIARQNPPAPNLQPVTEPPQSRPADPTPWKTSPSPSRFSNPASHANVNRFTSPSQHLTSTNGDAVDAHNHHIGNSTFSSSTALNNVDSFKTGFFRGPAQPLKSEHSILKKARTVVEKTVNSSNSVCRVYSTNVTAASTSFYPTQRLPFLRPRNEDFKPKPLVNEQKASRNAAVSKVSTTVASESTIAENRRVLNEDIKRHISTVVPSGASPPAIQESSARSLTPSPAAPLSASRSPPSKQNSNAQSTQLEKAEDRAVNDDSRQETHSVVSVDRKSPLTVKQNPPPTPVRVEYTESDIEDRGTLQSACSREIARILSDFGGCESSDDLDGEEETRNEKYEVREEPRCNWRNTPKDARFVEVGTPHGVRPLSPCQPLPRPDQIVTFPPPAPSYYPQTGAILSASPSLSHSSYEGLETCAIRSKNFSNAREPNGYHESHKANDTENTHKTQSISNTLNNNNEVTRSSPSRHIQNNDHAITDESRTSTPASLPDPPIRGGLFATALTIAPERPYTPLQSTTAATIFTDSPSLPEPSECYVPQLESDNSALSYASNNVPELRRPRLADALTTIGGEAETSKAPTTEEGVPELPSLDDDPSAILRRPSSVVEKRDDKKVDDGRLSRSSLRQELEMKMDEKRAVWRAERRPRFFESDVASAQSSRLTSPAFGCRRPTPTNFEATVSTCSKVFGAETKSTTTHSTTLSCTRTSRSRSRSPLPSPLSVQQESATSRGFQEELTESSTTLVVTSIRELTSTPVAQSTTTTSCHRPCQQEAQASKPHSQPELHQQKQQQQKPQPQQQKQQQLKQQQEQQKSQQQKQKQPQQQEQKQLKQQPEQQHQQQQQLQQQQKQQPQQHPKQQQPKREQLSPRMEAQPRPAQLRRSPQPSPKLQPRRRLSSVAEEHGGGSSTTERTTSRQAAASLLARRLGSLQRGSGATNVIASSSPACTATAASTDAGAQRCANKSAFVGHDDLGSGGSTKPSGAFPTTNAAPSSAGLSAPRRGKGVWNPQNASPGARIPLCALCNSQIRGPFVTALGKIWCPEHFLCVNEKCGRSLLDIGFVEEPTGLYCEYCFERYLAPTCAKCSSKIKADCLNAIGKHFHPNCFTCAYCGRLFGNDPFFLEDGLPYCENDWNELFTTKCFACGFPIEAGDRWVEALENNYHSPCFNCTICKTNLEGQSFYAKAGRPYCKMHSR